MNDSADAAGLRIEAIGHEPADRGRSAIAREVLLTDAQRLEEAELGRKHWLVWVSAGLAAALALVPVLFVWSIGTFDAKDGSDSTIAAAIALVGSVVAASIAYVGTALKFSIDDRSARLAAIDARRGYVLAVEASRRNQVEVAIRAVDLLGEPSGDASEHQMAGAVLALASLGEHELAVSLLSELFPAKVAPAVVELVLARALDEGSKIVRDSAVWVLWQNVDNLVEDSGVFYWPIRSSEEGSTASRYWRTDLSRDCRHGLIGALSGMFLACLSKGTINPAVILHEALTKDVDPYVQQIASACLQPLLEQLPPETIAVVGSTAIRVGDIARVEPGGPFETEHKELRKRVDISLMEFDHANSL